MKLIKKPAFLAAGIKTILSETELFVKIPEVYEKWSDLVKKVNYRKNDLTLEITLKKEKQNYTMFVGTEVTHMTPLPGMLVGIKIPEATYLYYLHEGKASDIYSAYVKMYDFVLQENLAVDKDEFKMEIHDAKNSRYHLYLRLN